MFYSTQVDHCSFSVSHLIPVDPFKFSISSSEEPRRVNFSNSASFISQEKTLLVIPINFSRLISKSIYWPKPHHSKWKKRISICEFEIVMRVYQILALSFIIFIIVYIFQCPLITKFGKVLLQNDTTTFLGSPIYYNHECPIPIEKSNWIEAIDSKNWTTTEFPFRHWIYTDCSSLR